MLTFILIINSARSSPFGRLLPVPSPDKGRGSSMGITTPPHKAPFAMETMPEIKPFVMGMKLARTLKVSVRQTMVASSGGSLICITEWRGLSKCINNQSPQYAYFGHTCLCPRNEQTGYGTQEQLKQWKGTRNLSGFFLLRASPIWQSTLRLFSAMTSIESASTKGPSH